MSVSPADFRYLLPERLIARYPAGERTASRMLCLDGRSGSMQHRIFRDLTDIVGRGDLLVFNDTRVIPARLFAHKRDTGGRVEILVERLLSTRAMLAQLRASKAPREGAVLSVGELPGEVEDELVVEAREDGFFRLRLTEGEVSSMLERRGHTPLPPYIDREDELLDRSRYQTVYARHSGSVAAPTAGLHFDDELLGQLAARGVDQQRITLHVGAGTFQPIRCERLADHRMHAEFVEVSEQVCDAVMRTHRDGGRVIAVGTTTVRCLETASLSGQLLPYAGDTRLFIYPPYRFRSVDAMITNFHLPESTLLMLVCAFAGQDTVLRAYQQAVDERYRFFSYGDAMFIAGAQAPLLKTENCRP